MFECISVCACGFIEISGNTVGNYQQICSGVCLAFSFNDSGCAIYKYSVSSSRLHASVSIFFTFPLFFSSAGTALCCSCSMYGSLRLDNSLHIVIGEGIRQRCQRAQWVKGEKENRHKDKGGIPFFQKDNKSRLGVHRHIGAWREKQSFTIVSLIVQRQDK